MVVYDSRCRREHFAVPITDTVYSCIFHLAHCSYPGCGKRITEPGESVTWRSPVCGQPVAPPPPAPGPPAPPHTAQSTDCLRASPLFGPMVLGRVRYALLYTAVQLCCKSGKTIRCTETRRPARPPRRFALRTAHTADRYSRERSCIHVQLCNFPLHAFPPFAAPTVLCACSLPHHGRHMFTWRR